MPSFTVTTPDLEDEGPVIEVVFSLNAAARAAYVAAGEPIPRPIRATVLIDTGASHSVVMEGLLDPLGLKPVSATSINTASSTSVPCAVYAVRMTLPSNDYLDKSVIAAPSAGLVAQNIQGLIGRDVLSDGIFIYQGAHDSFTLSLNGTLGPTVTAPAPSA